jgi:voltage-gated potassium channel
MLTLSRWEKRADPVLAVAAVAYLVTFALPILDTSLSGGWRAVCRAVSDTIWVLFIADFLTRIWLADRKWHYIGRHVPDLLMIALPMLRTLRLLRVVMLLRYLNRHAAESLQGRVAIYVGGSTPLVLFCAAVAVLDAERHSAHANITSFGDALWWAATTVTTVGYGDHYPVTTEGRFVAVALMLAGVALLGVVTASIASWFIDRVRQIESETQAATRADLTALRSEIQQLRSDLGHAADSGMRPRP